MIRQIRGRAREDWAHRTQRLLAHSERATRMVARMVRENRALQVGVDVAQRMRLFGWTTCSCGAPIVARTIRPETIINRARQVRGLDIEETCANGHVANFTAESITMTELQNARIPEQAPMRDLTQVEMARLLWEERNTEERS